MTDTDQSDEIVDFYVIDLPNKLWQPVRGGAIDSFTMADDLHEWLSEQIQDDWLFEVHLNSGKRGISTMYYATLTFADKAEATIFKMVWL